MRGNRYTELVGASQEMTELRDEIDRVAHSDAKVLISGESGVGKELVARAVHSGSPRASRPFVAVNCAGLPETLLETELFGHVKGSFTGAYRDKPGKLEAAHNGAVFLDEVGEMTLRMQGMLLRFLETGELQKVGSDRSGGTVDVRVIAATNRSLKDMVVAGQFREDLYYRLNVIHLVVPPLRQRRDDIPLLINHFLKRFSSTNGGTPVTLAPDARAALLEYAWPGNVRELQNVLERVVVTRRSDLITRDDLPPETLQGGSLSARPRRERRRTVVDDLFQKLTHDRESFWTAVYPLYMHREITRNNIRDLVVKGLSEAKGNYKIVVRMFNMESGDYKKFLNFLRKHNCQVPFKEFR